jgi:hypothetical protein
MNITTRLECLFVHNALTLTWPLAAVKNLSRGTSCVTGDLDGVKGTSTALSRGVAGIWPTNNAMEQRMGFVAIDHKITRGERGRRWCEPMGTVLATCVQQGRSSLAFLHHSLLAHFTKQPSPSLLPLPP